MKLLLPSSGRVAASFLCRTPVLSVTAVITTDVAAPVTSCFGYIYLAGLPYVHTYLSWLTMSVRNENFLCSETSSWNHTGSLTQLVNCCTILTVFFVPSYCAIGHDEVAVVSQLYVFYLGLLVCFKTPTIVSDLRLSWRHTPYSRAHSSPQSWSSSYDICSFPD